MITGAELLVRMLRAYQVEVIFGVPGDTNVPLYAALQQSEDCLRHVMARDERSAGFMADAYARLSRRPGVVEVPSGAGALYALPAIAEAHQSSIPLLLITSDTPIALEGRGVITELDCAKLFETVTKASILVKSPTKIPEIIRRAFRVMTSGRPGAVHLAIPEDVLAQGVEDDSLSCHAEIACRSFPSSRGTASAAQLALLRGHLAAAKRPLFVFGGGVNVSGAGPLATKIAELLSIPVVTTITGQSSIPDYHALSIGVIGDNGFHPHAMTALEDCDLAIYLGCRIGSVATVGWSFPRPRSDRRVIQIDVDPAVLGNNTNNVLSICGDAFEVLESLAAEMPDRAGRDPQWIDHLNGLRGGFWSALAESNEETGALKPHMVVENLGKHLNRPVTLLSDAGTPTPNLTRFLRMKDPEARLIIPRAFGGLGYAIPAVVGAFIAQPDRKPIGLFGDGSFNMSCGELETLVRLQVPALLIHFNNACFGWIKALQRSHGHNTTYSVDFTAGNVADIAEAFGLRAWRVSDLETLEQAIIDGMAHNGPALIDIIVESIADVSPPVFSWLRRAGTDPLRLAPSAVIRLGENHPTAM